MQQDPARRAALSKRMKELWESGHFKNRDKYKGQRYKEIWFRSSWEVIAAKWFDQQGLTWTYEPQVFRLEWEGEAISYIPDFWVEEWGIFVEVKAQWAWDLDASYARTKVLALEASGQPISVMLDEEIQAMAAELS